MKLELKHLAPYLPYGLKVKCEHPKKNLIYDLEQLRLNNDYPIRINCDNESAYGAMLSEISPILRPLSDLTKEIEMGGKKFIPLVEFAKELNSERILDKIRLNDTNMAFRVNNKFTCFDTTIRYCGETKSIKQGTSTTYKNHLKLIEWHFDVFGLIEKGLAIDINTLK